MGVPAHAASVDRDANSVTAVTALQASNSNVVVPVDVELSFDRGSVTSEAAHAASEISVQDDETEEVEPAPVETEEAPVQEAAAGVEAEAATAAVVDEPEEPAQEADVSSSGIGAALVGSAYSQIGVMQDCTAMVEKALRSAGKSVGDIAPEHFYAYGDVVSSPAPGDLVIRPGHVGIYVGNGQVISGGWNGSNTALHSLSLLPGSSFVRVG